MTSQPSETLQSMVRERLAGKALEFAESSWGELANGVTRARFAALQALASRHAKRRPVSPSAAENERLETLAPEVCLRHWNLLELVRVSLILARTDLEQSSFAEDFEAQFVYADEGETCALYRALAFLPAGERFAWRAGEGCRTNMQSVFTAIALDSPYPARHFDATAWNQLVMKTLFLEQPAWRIVGLDGRRSAELTRMALDFAEERESAGRHLPLGLWLCLEGSDAERTQALGVRHFDPDREPASTAIVLAMARTGLDKLATELAARLDNEPLGRCLQNRQTEQIHFARLVAGDHENEL